jgi:Cu(I)/Ag(I) efflux system periplasmic protein CusF
MRKIVAFATGLLLAAGIAYAQQAGPVTGTGTVKKVDAKTHTLNLAHDAIPAIKWPAMQMDFPVAPAVDLSALKVGQVVEFTLTPAANGNYAISAIKPKN